LNAIVIPSVFCSVALSQCVRLASHSPTSLTLAEWAPTSTLRTAWLCVLLCRRVKPDQRVAYIQFLFWSRESCLHDVSMMSMKPVNNWCDRSIESTSSSRHSILDTAETKPHCRVLRGSTIFLRQQHYVIHCARAVIRLKKDRRFRLLISFHFFTACFVILRVPCKERPRT